ncbi:hypothetical protein B7492_18585 [Bacillus mycoides]|uniref:Uncharacterized protein n=1 Tax=Bacillus mycoides TaxID=1405 RepID=A0A1W6AB38_BACMY|nr:hypothetical protein B7492_18585 [Bacillus mycoides]
MHEIISAIFKIYRSFLRIYQRFSKYIGDSTTNIDLPTNNDSKKGMQHYAAYLFPSPKYTYNC